MPQGHSSQRLRPNSQMSSSRDSEEKGVFGAKIANIVEELWEKGTTASGDAVEKKFILTVCLQPENLPPRTSISDLVPTPNKNNKRKHTEYGEPSGTTSLDVNSASWGNQRCIRTMDDLKPNQVSGYFTAGKGSAVCSGLYAITCPVCPEVPPYLKQGRDPIFSMDFHMTIGHKEFLGQRALVPLTRDRMVELYGTLITDGRRGPSNDSPHTRGYSPPPKRVQTETTFQDTAVPQFMSGKKNKEKGKVRFTDPVVTEVKEEIELVPGFDPNNFDYLKSDSEDDEDDQSGEPQSLEPFDPYDGDLGPEFASSYNIDQPLDIAMAWKTQTTNHDVQKEGEVTAVESSKSCVATNPLPLPQPDGRLSSQATSASTKSDFEIDIDMVDQEGEHQVPQEIEQHLASVSLENEIVSSKSLLDIPVTCDPQDDASKGADAEESLSEEATPVIIIKPVRAGVIHSDDEQYFR